MFVVTSTADILFYQLAEAEYEELGGSGIIVEVYSENTLYKVYPFTCKLYPDGVFDSWD